MFLGNPGLAFFPHPGGRSQSLSGTPVETLGPEVYLTYVGVWTLPCLQDVEPLRAIHSPALIS